MRASIPVHSFVDLVTNSSSETFIVSDRMTVETIKKMIDAILTAGKSEKRCGDLFSVGLRNEESGYGPSYKVIEIVAINERNQKAAKIIEEINTAFQTDVIGND